MTSPATESMKTDLLAHAMSEIDSLRTQLYAAHTKNETALSILRDLVRDVECYCTDNVASHEPCPIHAAQALLNL